MDGMIAVYKAVKKGNCASKIEIKNDLLPIEINQMIVWIMMHEAEALALLPEYQRIRAEGAGNE